MLIELGEIFLTVIAPVFGLVVLGYVAGPRLELKARTLSRYAYYLLVPAFVFNVMSTATADTALTLRMVAFILLVQVGCALLGFAAARLLGHGRQMIGAFVLIAAFANVGNFGLPVIAFRYSEEALLAATVYFLAIVFSGFVIGVTAASWAGGRGLGAVADVARTPALLALAPALLVNWFDVALPLAVTRMVALLAAAMVPTMLVTLGVQLADTRDLLLNRDVVAASAVRLLGAPLLALLLVAPFGLPQMERGVGVIQQGMPAAVLTAIIALEYDLAPDFVTTTVLFSTVASVVTLTLLLALV